MRFPRTPLASALLAAALFAAVPASSQTQSSPAAVYDVRRAPDYDATLTAYIAKKLGYAFDEKSGALTAPGGRRVTREEAEGVFYDEGADRLTDRERSVLTSLGYRFAPQNGHPVVLEYDSGAPFTPLRLAIIRSQIKVGLMDEAGVALNAATLDAETAAWYVKGLGFRRDGNRFLDSSGKVLTHAEMMRIGARVDAVKEPDVAALVKLAGYVVRRRGDAVLLWSPKDGWLDRSGADSFLKANGLSGQRDPQAPFIAGKDVPDAIKAALSRPPGELGPDGRVTWEGAPLTVAGYRRLIQPVEPGHLTAAERIYVHMAVALGFSESADGKAYLAQDGKSRLTHLDAAALAANLGLVGQHGLDMPFDSRAPAAAAVTKQLLSIGLTVNSADGTLRREPRVSVSIP